MTDWLSGNWFTFLQSIGITVGLLVTSYTLWRDVKARKISNYISLIQYHRDIWKLTIDRPELNRIRDMDSDLRSAQLTPSETQFLSFVFLHITCSYEMQKHNQMVNIERLKYDLQEFTRAPLVRRFWEENKRYYNADFVTFVEASINSRPKWLDEGDAS